jgi:hypothetical protein
MGAQKREKFGGWGRFSHDDEEDYAKSLKDE